MKRFLSLLLALCLLCTPAAAAAAQPFQLPDDLFDGAQLQEKTQQVIERMREFTDEIKTMTDEELEAKIREVAEDAHIPTMNQEQIDFLVKVCRSFETMENFGETVKDYEEKVNRFGSNLRQLMDLLGSLMDRLSQLLESLTDVLDRLGGGEPA